MERIICGDSYFFASTSATRHMVEYGLSRFNGVVKNCATREFLMQHLSSLELSDRGDFRVMTATGNQDTSLHDQFGRNDIIFD